MIATILLSGCQRRKCANITPLELVIHFPGRRFSPLRILRHPFNRLDILRFLSIQMLFIWFLHQLILMQTPDYGSFEDFSSARSSASKSSPNNCTRIGRRRLR